MKKLLLKQFCSSNFATMILPKSGAFVEAVLLCDGCAEEFEQKAMRLESRWKTWRSNQEPTSRRDELEKLWKEDEVVNSRYYDWERVIFSIDVGDI